MDSPEPKGIEEGLKRLKALERRVLRDVNRKAKRESRKSRRIKLTYKNLSNLFI